MVKPSRSWLKLARSIDPERAATFIERLGEDHAAAVLLATAYPALAPPLERDPRLIEGPRAPTQETWDAFLALPRGDAFDGALRRLNLRVRLRIALRELLPPDLGGEDIEVTAEELSRLADATIAAALREAEAETRQRLGPLLRPDGSPARISILGMGKLGGLELNCGSDVDLVCVYDSDLAEAKGPADRTTSAHRFWTKVVQRMTEHLETPTEDGFVWRVDHRLRPEGARGPLVNGLGAFERYYESFGRLWERAAMLRARPVAGDRSLGEEVMATLRPFVWRRRVDPTIASPLLDLVHRAQSDETKHDLKLGAGGIREAEFFVQILQLVWGGLDPRLRPRRTLAAAERLHGAGLMTDRERQELIEAYLDYRRAEHAVQWSTGVQTHCLPDADHDRERLARTLGYDDREALESRIAHHRERVAELLGGLLPDDAPPKRWGAALGALDGRRLEAFEAALVAAGMPDVARSQGQLARDLFETARVPAGPLGTRVIDRQRHLADGLLDAIADAADPIMATRHLRGFVSRVRPVGVYTKLLSDEPAAVRRLVTALGGSSFVGEAVSRHPELADLVLFDRSVPTAAEARAEMLSCVASLSADADLEEQAGPVRRAKQRIEVQVALADLAGDLQTPAATSVLSAVADGALEVATRLAVGQRDGVTGIAVLAMGKLGGREIGYGSDLDVIFVYDPETLGSDDPGRRAQRAARRIIQNMTAPHHEGPGYELDTRLRPSGNQGMLVVSLASFARYHEVALNDDESPHSGRSRRAASWEKLALLRARFAAGDARLGEKASTVVERAVYGRAHDFVELAGEMHRLRERMELELAREGPGRFDLKFGRGGLVDVEFAVQLLQLAHGHEHPSIRTTSTPQAIAALAEASLLSGRQAAALGEGYAFLRRLEQRLRIVHADGDHLLGELAPGLLPLARRMGVRDEPGFPAGAVLIRQFQDTTRAIRRVYAEVVAAAAAVGLPPSGG